MLRMLSLMMVSLLSCDKSLLVFCPEVDDQARMYRPLGDRVSITTPPTPPSVHGGTTFTVRYGGVVSTPYCLYSLGGEGGHPIRDHV